MLRLTLAAVLSAATVAAQPLTDAQVARRAKCQYLWQRLNATSYTPDRAAFFCHEHELQGIAEEWWYSLIYAYSGSDGLNPRMRYSAGGMTARGLMDCTERQYPLDQALRRFGRWDLYDVECSIANHCYQAGCIHRNTGREEYALMRAVFLPRSPDGRRARREQRRWQRIERRHLGLLAAGYASGAIGERTVAK